METEISTHDFIIGVTHVLIILMLLSSPLFYVVGYFQVNRESTHRIFLAFKIITYTLLGILLIGYLVYEQF